jgi:hypothetical protein
MERHGWRRRFLGQPQPCHEVGRGLPGGWGCRVSDEGNEEAISARTCCWDVRARPAGAVRSWFTSTPAPCVPPSYNSSAHDYITRCAIIRFISCTQAAWELRSTACPDHPHDHPNSAPGFVCTLLLPRCIVPLRSHHLDCLSSRCIRRNFAPRAPPTLHSTSLQIRPETRASKQGGL